MTRSVAEEITVEFFQALKEKGRNCIELAEKINRMLKVEDEYQRSMFEGMKAITAHMQKGGKVRYSELPLEAGANVIFKDLLKKYGSPCAAAMAESAARNVRMLEEKGFDDMVVSIKTSDVRTAVEAYRLYDAEYNPSRYPLHVGVTEAGTLRTGTIKSSVGIGALLLDGIGDTIRVSLSADPVEEVRAAKILLRSLGLRKSGLQVISCPTCGRTTVDSIGLANRIEAEFDEITFPVKVAVMGCVVNGIGEAGEADFGVTGANGKYVLFKKDTVIKDIPEEKVFDVVREEIEKIGRERT